MDTVKEYQEKFVTNISTSTQIMLEADAHLAEQQT
jgi:hypothetical protein